MATDIGALTVIFTEFYYWVTVVIMFLIHVGFCMYEVGASRRKNHMHTLMKNTMLIPLVTVTFFFFGWWIYFAFPNGPFITGGWSMRAHAVPWSELMGPHIGGPRRATPDARGTAVWARINGVFWAAFLLFSWTAASIVSGAVIERIRSGPSGSWRCWSARSPGSSTPPGAGIRTAGWCSSSATTTPTPRGVIHAIAGGSALGVLVVLGPRIGKFARRRHAAQHHAAQPLAGDHRAVPDLHRLLGLLRGLQRADHRRRATSARDGVLPSPRPRST